LVKNIVYNGRHIGSSPIKLINLYRLISQLLRFKTTIFYFLQVRFVFEC
jgi:hypothetical protein